MLNEKTVRFTLALSCPFNFIAAYAALFPASWLGGWAGLPPDPPLVYASVLSFMIAVFGIVYAWLATSTPLDLPLLCTGALGKIGVFLIMLGLWLAGQGSTQALVLATGDLALGSFWVLWLLRASR